MLLGKVAFGCLYRRGKLYFINISRLYFCLHQKVHDAADLLADDAQIADLLLQNDGLGDNSISGGLTVTCDRKEAAVLITDTAFILVIKPEAVFLRRDFMYLDRDGFIAFRYPG